ncbi:hypothetical protein HMPREF9131_0085 [Peptoniphilus sp. oral taxon 836 str. F0141]|nr:hypothetical protein HMPREF9131_0085 [Peptoniphilus sp. oral taxon 836 str. F0141]
MYFLRNLSIQSPTYTKAIIYSMNIIKNAQLFFLQILRQLGLIYI